MWFTLAQFSSASRTLRTGFAIQAKFQTDALPFYALTVFIMGFPLTIEPQPV
jgi:hypothetical protein